MAKLTSRYETRFPGIILVIAVATEMNLHITGVKQSHQLRFSRVVIVVVRVVVRVVVCVGEGCRVQSVS